MNKKISMAAAALSVVASPLAAAPNPAASLSIAPSVRAGSATGHRNGVDGGIGTGGLIVIAAATAAVVGGIILATRNNNEHQDERPTSR